MTTSLVDLYSDFSPATDDEIEQISQETNDEPTEQLPAGWPYSMNPRGSNTLPLVTNFAERLRYKNANYFNNLATPIDLYYNKNYYGRVDRFQNAILPRMLNPLYKPIAQENHFSFNFMADAFWKFRRNMKIATDIGAIEKYRTNLGEITATRGWNEFTNRYKAQTKTLHVFFLRHLHSLEKKKFNKIVNFVDYIDELYNYLATGKHKAPITLTGMVLDQTSTPLMTGLAIEIAQENYSSDAVKYDKYISDVNFSYYTRAARKFGLYVDRNGPWRLWADVFSPPMINETGFLAAYGVNENSFFDTYYQRTYTMDMKFLISELVNSYNVFVTQNPRIIESLPGTLKCPTPSFSVTGVRNIITSSSPEVVSITPLFWLRLYFTIRSLESGVKYKNKKQLLRRAVDIAAAYDWHQSVIFINNLFKPYLYDERLFKSLTPALGTVRIGSVSDMPFPGGGAY